MVNLNEFYQLIQARADTEGLQINAADVSRVLGLAFDILGKFPAHYALAVLAKASQPEDE